MLLYIFSHTWIVLEISLRSWKVPKNENTEYTVCYFSMKIVNN